MSSSLHAVTAVVPASSTKDKFGIAVHNSGHYRCEANGCAFEGTLEEGIGHTIKNQPNLVTEAK